MARPFDQCGPSVGEVRLAANLGRPVSDTGAGFAFDPMQTLRVVEDPVVTDGEQVTSHCDHSSTG
jgi:hypothetical protein